MGEYITKPWDWSKNTEETWQLPCVESAFLAERWNKNGFHSFLDVGCGLGRHSLYMAEKGFAVTAIDLSEYGIEKLCAEANNRGLKIDTHICNMVSLPFSDDSFDCAMAYNVIYHTDSKGFKAALSELYRVLRPGGELFLTLLSKNFPDFQNADPDRMLDANTMLRDEHEAGKDIPHFHAGIGDIADFFSNWHIQQKPKEWCEYDLGTGLYFGKHWALLVRK